MRRRSHAIRGLPAGWPRRRHATWLRRGFLAAVLVGAAVIPGRAVSQHVTGCHAAPCRTAGSVLWRRALPGPWLAQPGVVGTVPSQDEAYVAASRQLAVIGFGLTVLAFQAHTGKPLWDVPLAGLPPGSVITSLRAWPDAVTVGVAPPPGQPVVPASVAGTPAPGHEVVTLSASNGRQIRAYPSTAGGGAVAADAFHTVVVGAHAVTSYDNANGRVLWRRSTGQQAQDWYVSGQFLYVCETRGGYLRSSLVTALRRISLRSGAEQVVHPPPGQSFTGRLSDVLGDVLLFSGNDGVFGYTAQDGHLLWHRADDVLEFTDTARNAVYLVSGDTLAALDPASGRVLGSQTAPVTTSLYTVRDGVALGLDEGVLGRAWGYDVSTKKVVWTSGALPWPHFFVDESGLGGSASPAADVVLLTMCARVGAAVSRGSAPSCDRPELAAVRF